uniref:Reverse transcriptase domain-containing protein n=1 Tax=Glossina brevipalpis TaxID=37001 RepID=A0A1A9WA87_9MUSC
MQNHVAEVFNVLKIYFLLWKRYCRLQDIGLVNAYMQLNSLNATVFSHSRRSSRTYYTVRFPTWLIYLLRERTVSQYLINIVTNYFTGRKVHYQRESRRRELLVTEVLPQGSILSYALWNITIKIEMELNRKREVKHCGKPRME